MAKLLIYILMQDSSPIGYIDVRFVKKIQLVYMDDIDFAIRKSFNALY